MPVKIPKEFTAFLKGNGFLRFRKAFFRIVNGEILQVVKFDYETHANAYFLRFGFFSLFEDLPENEFTPFGCIPQYEAMLLAGQKTMRQKIWEMDELSFFRMQKTGEAPPSAIVDGSGRFRTTEFASIEEQCSVFQEYGMQVLDEITDQRKLGEALCRWNLADGDPGINAMDYHRIAPYLSLGQFQEAAAIADLILQQNLSAMESKKAIGIFPDEITQAWLDQLRFLKESDQEKTAAWLRSNLQRNMTYFEEHVLKKSAKLTEL